MEKKRLDDMESILALNQSIENLYNHLYELEINGKMNSDEYKEYVDMIRFAVSRCDRYMLKWPLSDVDANDFIQLLLEINRYDKYDPINYIDRINSIKVKRFIEHNYELSMLYHETDIEDSENDGIYIDNVQYDFETGIAKLEELDKDEMAEECRFLYEQSLLEEEEEKDRDDMDYAKHNLDSHTFMLYLLDAINSETNEETKNKLIAIKYKIISIVRNLEDTFLSNHEMDYDIARYQHKLHSTFHQRPTLYTDYLNYLEQVISKERIELVERNKKEYTNEYDKIQDTLLALSLKTHLSCIPNQAIREAQLEDYESAIKATKSKIDKKVLKKSIKLNNNYIIYDESK